MKASVRSARRTQIRGDTELREAASKTARTPWPGAGCNKPAGSHAEQTAKVGKNDKGGRCSTLGSVEPKRTPLRESEAGQDASDTDGGGAIFGKPHERKFGCTRRSTEELQSPSEQRETQPNRTDRTASLKAR